MNYYLTAIGFGIARDRTPVPAKGKVLLTFEGKPVDSVCVGGCFYPIQNGRAEIPADKVEGATPVTAYALAEGRRYVCDALCRLACTPPMIAPVNDGWEGQLLSLCDALGKLHDRVVLAEEELLRLRELTEGNPFTFGGAL